MNKTDWRTISKQLFTQTFEIADIYLTKRNLDSLEEELLRNYYIEYLNDDPKQIKTNLALRTFYLFKLFNPEFFNEFKVISVQEE